VRAIISTLVALLMVAAGAVCIVVLGLGHVPDSDEREIVVLAGVGAAVAAIAYRPARRAIGRVATRSIPPPDEVIRRFGERSTRGIATDELLEDLASSLRRSMRASAIEIWARAGTALARTVSIPERPAAMVEVTAQERDAFVRTPVAGPSWLRMWMPALPVTADAVEARAVPAAFAGDLLGVVVVERTEDQGFTDADDHALAELGRRLGVVLHNRQLDAALQETLDDLQRANEELVASRARVVAAADDARRRIERDLHDGAQQHLVAIGVELNLLRNVLSSDPDSAVAMLDQVTGELRQTVQEVRELAHGIYPPLLAANGLDQALRTAATRHPGDVRVEAGDVGRYGEDVEAAIYFCCLEALQNAAKHAPDAHVLVRVSDEDEVLAFEVSDDGPGFDLSGPKSGRGLQHMRDRVGAIGGSLTIESAPGAGTCIRGTVPR
jgi:signal transduction histidine kinase